MERSSERALYTARTNSRLPVIPPTSPPPHLFDLQLKMPPPPSTVVSPTPQLSPHLTQVSISSLGPAIQLLVHKTTYAPMIYTALLLRFLMWADR